MRITNLLTIDVEDYFQVSAFEKVSPVDTWDARECRVERNTDLIIELLEQQGYSATFFTLGWIAKRFPGLVRRIANAGHEIASHGYEHQRIYGLQRSQFREDIRKSKSLLEDISGHAVHGYRAPSYSISPEVSWAFDELYDAGYRYDSSIFPVKHDYYGISKWPRFSGYAVKTPDGNWCHSDVPNAQLPFLWEIPITTLSVVRQNLPIAGGGYFRLLPYLLTRTGLKRINNTEEKPFIFYLHPWELDPDQPRLHGVGLKSRFRHYLHLHKTEQRFKWLLRDFSFAAVQDVFPEICTVEP